jgi:hypothetical protein
MKATTANLKSSTIEEKYFRGSQSVEFTGIYNIEGFKLKVAIDRDSIDYQSSAIIYVWQTDSLQWSKVASIHYTQMESLKVFAYANLADINKSFIQSDRNHLINLAKQILF